jgi:hypothetical protein
LQTHGVTVYLKNESNTELKRILNIIGEVGKQSIWEISDVECLGENSEALQQISDEVKTLSGEDFYELVSGIYQVIDGNFRAYKPDETKSWLSIKWIRGDEFDIETKDEKLLKGIRESFKDVRDLVY